MASSQDHIKQWKHNRDFLGVVPPEYPDWFVTVTCYVALHAVDALLAHDKVARVTSHSARNEVLARTNRYSKISSLYMPLYDLSRTVRYLANPNEWVPPLELDKNILKRYLYPIERSVEHLIGASLGSQPIVIRAGSTPGSPHVP